jgi:hypothetical protein
MKVFISWSGEKAKKIAIALQELLGPVLQAVKPWVSEVDIDPGVRWSPKINEELSQTDYGIICLTPENLTSPWILFEAGALSKSVDNARVCPYLFNVDSSDIKPPLSQFQGVKADDNGTRRLLSSINNALGDNALSDDRFTKLFDRFWPDLKNVLDQVTTETSSSTPSTRPPDDMLKELLELARDQSRMLRDLPSSLRTSSPEKVRWIRIPADSCKEADLSDFVNYINNPNIGGPQAIFESLAKYVQEKGSTEDGRID